MARSLECVAWPDSALMDRKLVQLFNAARRRIVRPNWLAVSLARALLAGLNRQPPRPSEKDFGWEVALLARCFLPCNGPHRWRFSLEFPLAPTTSISSSPSAPPKSCASFSQKQRRFAAFLLLLFILLLLLIASSQKLAANISSPSPGFILGSRALLAARRVDKLNLVARMGTGGVIFIALLSTYYLHSNKLRRSQVQPCPILVRIPPA